jgi:predicted  nucleic acid-binding Zn-ribbon protein
MIDPNDFDETPAGPACDRKCPYCREVRSSRARLAAHIYRVHRQADTRENLAAAAGRERTAADTNAGMDAAKQDIASIGRTLTDIAERMQRLDDAAISPDAVRRSVLEEVAQRLVDAGDAAGYSIDRAMIRERI